MAEEPVDYDTCDMRLNIHNDPRPIKIYLRNSQMHTDLWVGTNVAERMMGMPWNETKNFVWGWNYVLPYCRNNN